MTQSSFADLNLKASVIEALNEEGYKSPTPIQAQVIPAILNNQDILATAHTGTGKTAAFALPILHKLEDREKATKINEISTLILSPTRELALQIGESFSTYGKFMQAKNQVIFGGQPVDEQIASLQSGPDILVATPGRLLDLVSREAISLRKVKTLVLDEADRMLDMGFIEDIRKIIEVIPKQRQTLLFSATLTEEVSELAKSILIDPVIIDAGSDFSAAEKIAQSVYFIEKKNKPALLAHILKNKEIKRVLVFTRTKAGADELLKALEKAKIKAAVIHGNKSQDSRQKALNNFKEGEIRVLVATDIAARGIDIEDLKYVINYELPIQPETYVHRIGRTGRAGNEGIALSFCEPEELQYLKDIKETIEYDIPFADHPYQLSVKSYTKPVLPPATLPIKKAGTKKTAGKNKTKKRGFSKA